MQRALMQVLRIKALALAQLADPDAVNAFQWSKALLSKHHPLGLAAVERFEADSKFFRSFAVALLLLAVILIGPGVDSALAALCALLLLPVLWRYVDQRRKAIQQAYRFVISLGRAQRNRQRQTVRASRRSQPTHAGGAVYRVSGDKAEYLIIQAREDPIRMGPAQGAHRAWRGAARDGGPRSARKRPATGRASGQPSAPIGWVKATRLRSSGST